MEQQHEYNILISANCLSILDQKDLNNKLVASLYNIETGEKVSDGDNEKFEILDYNFTNVISNRKSIDIFITNTIKKVIVEIIENNGWDMSLFNPVVFNKALNGGNFVITEYQISRIYTLAEIYFQIMQKSTIYGELIEYIVSYDVLGENQCNQ